MSSDSSSTSVSIDRPRVVRLYDSRLQAGIALSILACALASGTALLSGHLAGWAGAAEVAAMGASVCAGVATWVAARRALRPLTSLHEVFSHRSPEPSELRELMRDEDLWQIGQGIHDLASQRDELVKLTHELQRELESRTQHRQGELQRLQQQLLDEAHEKEEFLRTVSHDLGAPLRNISGMATMLLLKYRGHLADEAVLMLERISASVKGQLELVSGLLEVSRLRHQEPRREIVNLSQLVQQLRDSLAFDLERSQIDLRVAADLPTIVAERMRLRQVFQNLLDNAIKYMLQSTTRRIELTWERTGGELHFMVSDTGSGIAAEDLPQLFQMFRRGTRTLGDKASRIAGRGVGLATVKAIVESYGGRVWAQSQLGAGTTMHFTLARRLVELDDASSRPSAAKIA